MTKLKKQYVCAECGTVSHKWQGQCFDCGAWSSITEEVITSVKNLCADNNLNQLSILDDNVEELSRTETSIAELDRILGGGLIPSSVVLIGGDPGIGKSTLLLQLSAILPQKNLPCLYITGEESLGQIKLRAKRLGISNNFTKVLACTNLETIIPIIANFAQTSCVVIIDSIQTMLSTSVASSAGTVSQIRHCAQELINYAKNNNVILLIACHVTKEGQLAGPKILEHMVDTVLYFEGDNNQHFRVLRSIKNRFGSVNEIGVFEMTEQGLLEVKNPSALFLSDRDKTASGSAVFAGIEGSRSLLVEMQALIAPSHMAMPRRFVVGWDQNRLSMILAVLNVRFGLSLSSHEVYLSVVGGLKITDPAADLAVVAALISAAAAKPISNNMAFFGEIGLAGEIRKVARSANRIKEAKKMGFNQIICAEQNDDKSLIHLSHIKQLKRILDS